MIMAAVAATFVSCDKASVSGSFDAVPSGRVLTAKTVDGAQMRTVDTIKIADNGSFKYAAKVTKGQPEFFYLYYGDTKVASLLLEHGDKVTVSCDTLGSWTVEGSMACQQLRDREAELAAFTAKGRITAKDFIEFYRKSLRFVLSNTHSLVSVPVLFSQVGQSPVFCQPTDGIVFNNVADSLETIYPESRYVKILRNEGALRCRQMEINTMLQTAAEAPYVDLNFDGMEGKSIALSSLAQDYPTVLVFWDVTQAADKMFLKDVMEPVYRKYAARGLKVYSVGMGADKTTWAMVVREQNLPWTNVCDPSARSINVYPMTQTPCVYILSDGKLIKPSTNNVNDLQFELNKVVK